MIDYQPESGDAWEFLRRVHALGPIDRRIVDYLQAQPSTSDEVEVALDLKHQTCSAQIRHLKEAGILVKTPDHRPTRSGVGAAVIRVAMAFEQGTLL